jgi:hypothetical protein
MPSLAGDGTAVADLATEVFLPAVLCSDDINIVAVLKAMGAESDQEVVQLVGPDEQLAALLMPSIQVGCWLGVMPRYYCGLAGNLISQPRS